MNDTMPVEENSPELDPYVDEYSPHLNRIQKLANALDSKFSIPGTKIRFGWDGIVGLIPGIGDTLALAPQAYLFYEAVQLKLGKRTLLKMLFNIGLDWLVGLVPLLGDLFDVAFKSNLRNARLVAREINKKRTAAP